MNLAVYYVHKDLFYQNENKIKGYVDPKIIHNYKNSITEYGDHDDEYIITNDDKPDARYLTKNPIGPDKKSDSFEVSNLKNVEIKTDRKKIVGKEEDDSRGRLNRRRGQERSGKMIHDRTNEKIPLIRRLRGGWKEIKKDEEMTSRIKTEKTYRRLGEEKRNKTVSVVVPKKGDVLDRQSGWAYRDGDKEPKFLTNREKRINVPKGYEANDQMSNLPSKEKYNQMVSMMRI
ncbi:uncharacterized protein LOC122519236 isoform X2 [Polistes fuscatus]|uniref:uncharacterized protein LOC122519236 isoform X2 n=1 Tax=Polistes fuscatus TaxID=30207 RepID=UPI001CA7DDC7|nr:uncharacterized protein LOC122519236 isoform X2 [Polistes fuscatus]